MTRSFLRRPSKLAASVMATAAIMTVLATPQMASALNGSALQFNGTTQYVGMGDALALGASTFTLETWFKRTGPGIGVTTGESSNAIPLVTKGRSQADGTTADMNYFLGISATTGRLFADFEEGAAGPIPGDNHPINGTAVVTSDVWHHAAATYDGQTWNLYLDGVLDATLTLPAAVAPRFDSLQDFGLGTAMTTGGTAAGFFAGIIDESRVWNVARTQAEIQTTKDSEVATSSGLVGRWGFNEGSGITVGDSAGSGAHGTTVGGPTWTLGFGSVPVGGAPNDPVLVAPVDGETGMSTGPTLTVNVSDPENDTLSVSFYGRYYKSGVFQLIGTQSGVPSGTNVSRVWSGLDGGQKYEWHATVSDSASTVTGANRTFSTTAGADPVIVGAGDIAECGGALSDATATNEIMTGVEGSIFTVGDNAYPGGTAAQFANCYDPTWGQQKTRTRPAAGNKEWQPGTITAYTNYFGAAATDAGGKTYYSYNVGDFWHVVVLDSECAVIAGGCGINSPQENWLEADLQANRARNVIAMFHRPLYSSGTSNTALMRPLWDVLYAEGADVVLAGHAHLYERMGPTNAAGTTDSTFGLRSFILGTGGASHGTIGTVRSNSQALNNTVFGVTKLTLHETSYDWDFMPVADGSFTDSGSQAIHGRPGNATPVATPQSVSTGRGVAKTITLAGTDANSDPLSFRITSLPTNGTLYDGPSATGTPLALNNLVTDALHRVTYLPSPPSFLGSDSFAFRVSDGNPSAPATVSITVANTAPTFDQDLPNRTDAENDVISLSSPATDAEGDTLTYAASGLPPGLSIDSSSGLISGTIGFAAAPESPYDVSVTVSDDGGTTIGATDTFTWTVTNTNRTPTFDQDLADRSSAEADAVSLPAPATDPDGDTLTYAATDLPNGLTIDGSTGLISGTVSHTAAAGSPFSVSVEVSDDGGSTFGDTDLFTWTVSNSNRTPTFNQDLPDRTDAEDGAVNLSAAGSDLDGDTLTYGATGLPTGLSINPSTGLITGTITFTAASGSPYSVTVDLSDDGGTTVGATDTFTWTVTNTNRTPAFDQNLPNRTDGENASIDLSAGATDLDGDTLTYGATGLPQGLSINSSTGSITGSISYDASPGSPYSVSVTVSEDGSATFADTDTFSWTVTNTNRPPAFNQNITGSADSEGDEISLSAAATDLDGDTLTYAVTGLPPGVTMNTSTGLISGTLGFNAAAGSPYAVSVTVSDDGFATVGATDAFSWTVFNTNRPPTFNQNVPNQTNTEGAAVSIPVGATDADGDTLTYAATGLPPGLSINPTTGLVSGTIGNTAATGSPYSTILKVSDNDGTSFGDTDSLSWTITAQNELPTFNQNLPNRSDGESRSVSLSAAATDLDGNTLTYAATSLPAGLSINASTGLITGTIGDNAAGASPYSVSITVSDDGGTTTGDTDTFSWTITANEAPTFDQDLDDRTNAEGEVVSLSAAATDLDSDPLEYAASGLPQGLSINASTGEISGTIGFHATAGSPHAIVITVSDDGGNTTSATDTFSWTIDNTNQQPTYDLDIVNRTDDESDAITIPAPASDDDGDTLTYSATNLPPGLSINSATGTISGTIDLGASGSSPYAVTLEVSDDGGATVGDTDTFTWTVRADEQPTFDDNIVSMTDDENDAISVPISATDVNDDPITFSATGLPTGLSINPSTGLISGTIAYTAAASSPFVVSLKVSDDGFVTIGDTDNFTWNVNNTNRPSTFNQNLPNRTDAEAAVVSIPSPANDPDGDTLTYSATGLPPGISINASTGLISGTIGHTAAAASPYAVLVTVSDDGDGGSLSANDAFSWTINNTNRPPTFDQDLGNRTDAETDVISQVSPASDLDGDSLTYDATGLPPGLSIDDSTGEISGTVAFNAAAGSPHSVSVTVSDDGGTTVGATDTFTWTITNSNRPPTFDQDLGNQSDAENDAISLASPATDLDGDTLTYSATGLPTGLSINTSTGQISGTIGFTAAASSPFNVSVSVSDNGGVTVGQIDTFTWTVSNTNRPPSFNQNLPNRTDGENDAVSLPAPATDPDGDSMTYDATGLPNGLSINPSTGHISGTIGFNASTNSPYSVDITVSDDGGTTVGATDAFTWTITNTNRLPIFDQNLVGETYAEGDVVSIPIGATDLDGDALTFGATGLPPGLSINPSTGEISGTIGFAAAAGSPHSVSVMVSDDNGVTVGDTDAFSWTVTNTNRAPTFDQNLPDRTDSESDVISLPAAATDSDGDTLSYAATGLPAGMSINASTGLIAGTIASNAAVGSPHAVELTVSDDGGTTISDTDIFSWEVIEQADILFRDSSFGANNVATSLAISKPAGVVNGDVMVAIVDVRQTPTVTPPAGWNQVSMTPNGTTYRQLVFTKVATGSEPASYTFTFNQSRGATGGIVAYDGVDPTTPVETFSAGTASSTNITAPSATTAFNGTMIVGGFSINNSSAIAPPAGMTERGEIASGSRIKTEIADYVQTPAGATGAKTAVAASATANIGQLIVLRPDGPPGPNQDPTFDQNLTDRSNGEGAGISLPVSATDPEGDALAYEATGLPPGLSINASTGLISGTISAGAMSGSPYSVELTVSDDGGTTNGDTDTFTWTVTEFVEQAEILFRSSSFAANPVATSLTIPKPAGVADGDVMVAVVDVKVAPTVTKPAGWNLLSTTPNGTNFRQLVYTKTVTGGEPASYQWTFNERRAASGGIVAYSGVDAADPVETFTAGSASSASITAPSATTANDGAMVVGAFSIANASAIAPPAGMTERGEIASKTKVKTEVADYVQTPAGATGAKTATAGAATANIGQLIVLRPGGPPVNQDPTFDQNLANRSNAEGATISLSAHATDPESDPLTYAATGLPTGLSINTSTGLITGTISAGAAAGSPYSTSITVSDDGGTTVGATDTLTWTVTVPGPNQDPTFDQNLANRSDAEGAAISLSAAATDPEGDLLTYAATGLPGGLSINTSTGLVSGTISDTAAASSPYSTSITVSDDGGTTTGATDTFTWTVTEPPPGGSIAFRSAAFGANNVGNNVVISTPAGIQTGDVMVAVLDVKAAPTVSTPAGWDLVSTTPNGSNFKQVVFSRVAASTEPASTTFTINQNRAISGGIVAYSGVNTSTPVEIFTAGTGTTVSITAPSATSAFNGAMVIGAFGINADSTIAPPAGMTERGEIVSATRIRTELSDFTLTSAGATGTKTATAATAAANIGQLILLRPL